MNSRRVESPDSKILDRRNSSYFPYLVDDPITSKTVKKLQLLMLSVVHRNVDMCSTAKTVSMDREDVLVQGLSV